MGAPNPTTAVAPEVVFRRIVLTAVVSALPIVLMARPFSPLKSTLVALGLQVVLALALNNLREDTNLRSAAIVAFALLGTPLAYFFGPNSAFAGVISLLLAITGLLTATQSPRRVRTGWLTLAAVCIGQLVLVALVAYGVWDDRSLSPILRHGKSSLQAITAHLAIQVVFVTAFLAGRAAQKRYRQLVLEAIDASRDVAIREALLEEARADYERARELSRLAEAPTAEHTATERESQNRPPRTEIMTADPTTSPRPRPSVTVIDDGTRNRFSAALQSKMRLQDLFVLGMCLAGVYFSATLVTAKTPRLVALTSIIAIVAMVALRAVLFYRRPDSVVTWPYPVIAFLSAGVAYGFGLHAGFAAIVATVLFSSRLFRSPAQQGTTVWSIVAVCTSHALVFALVTGGALPDESTLPLRLPGLAAWEPFLHHASVQALYIVAYLAGGRIDREFVAAYELARDAYAASMRANTQLQIARTELDAALRAEGLFTGTAVGNYKLGRLLGRGGMGEVYEAERDGTRVALKLLRADRLGDPVALERFAHEANLLMRIESPYCARIIEVSNTAVPFLAMEYVDGPSLSATLRERGRLDHTELVALVDDLARGLADVHAKGVVHLDVKPSNVLRDKSRWKIVDFGIARLLIGEAHRKIAGTPPYMAPEQALGEELGIRTDLYSLSLILYRAITGRPAYVGSDATVIAQQARTVGPPDPREVANVTEELALVMRIGLAANISDRFASTDELRGAFLGALTGRLDPFMRERGRELLARAPWAPSVALISGPRDSISRRSTK